LDFHGERRSKVTHVSTTDPEARLVLQSERPRGQAGPPRPCAHGEPVQAGGRGLRNPGRRADVLEVRVARPRSERLSSQRERPPVL